MKSLLLFTLLTMGLMVSATNDPITRDKAPESLKWRLTDIYASTDLWHADLKTAEQLLEKIASMKGTLGKSSENLLKFMQLNDEMNKITLKLGCYAQLQRSLDSRNADASNMQQLGQALDAKSGEALSWANPELVSIPKETVFKWIQENKAYEPYKFSLEHMYKMQDHVLPADQEQVASYFSGMANTPSSMYAEIAYSDNVYPEFVRSNGETVTLTRPMFTNILTFSNDRDERKRAFETYNKNYAGRLNTMAALYNGVCQMHLAYSKAYKFTSTLDASLNGNQIPVSVYENLIKVAGENSKPLQRYIELRKKVLNLPDYSPWDGNVSIGTYNRTYSYEEGTKIIREALKTLGEEYTKELDVALAGGWIDVYEGQGKETGAYSMGIYGVHPYILLNYDETINSVSTTAHELGHTMHSTFSAKNQPYKNHRYSSFVAEVASNFNEELLLDYLLANSNSKEEKIALLDQAINNLIGSFYRQSMFADYELQVHKLVEQGQPINPQVLNSIFHDLNTKYYGNTVKDHPYRDIMWAQVMHFYNLNYYVYQYATSFAAASHIHKLITTGSKEQRADALQKYLTLLKSGGNDYPVEQLRKAGVDMTTTEPTLAVVQRLNSLIDQLEKELL